PRSSRSTGPSPWPRPTGRRPASTWSTRSSSSASTSSTPSAPTCCAASAATTRRQAPTTPRSRAPTTTRSGASCAAAATRSLRRDRLRAELLADRDVDRVVDRQDDQRRQVERERVAQVAAEVVDRLAAERRHPERLGEADEVGVREVGPEVAAELAVLLPHDRPVLPVLPDDVDDRRLQPDGSLELLAVHEKAAVAVDGDHLALRMDELGGDRARQGEAHPCKPVCDQDRIGLMRG